MGVEQRQLLVAVNHVDGVVDVEHDRLGRHGVAYRKELDGAAIEANAKVAESLFRRATGEGREAVTAAIFWLKTRAGWKETSVHELRNHRPLSELTDAELEARIISLQHLLAASEAEGKITKTTSVEHEP
jgi:hypothetical protein